MFNTSSLVRMGAMALMASASSGLAFAQDIPARDLPQNGGAGIRTGNITSTGQTVPNPGASQSAGTTSLDRGIEHDDNKIQSSICKGC